MGKFVPNKSETIVARNDQIWLDRKYGDVVLTDKSLYLATYTMFGAVKNVVEIPLSSFHVINNTVSLTAKTPFGESPSIEFLADNVQHELTFREGEKVKMFEFANSICQILTGKDAEKIDRGAFGNALKDTVDIFKKAVNGVGDRNSSHQTISKPTKISKKCISCRAPISGTAGETVVCQYCDTEQVL